MTIFVRAGSGSSISTGVYQEFKVSPIGFISPDEQDESLPVFMQKTTKGVPPV
jgi:hypothetical protein